MTTVLSGRCGAAGSASSRQTGRPLTAVMASAHVAWAHRYMKRCPVHGSLVALDGDGRLLGRCDGCIAEAARALYRINHMPLKGAV